MNRQESVQYRKAIKVLIRTEGVRGLYSGICPLLLRDIPSWGVYFWCYEYLKKKLNLTNKDIKRLSWGQILTLALAGGVSGQLSWLCSYPFDVIKTIV